jgi:hypothetical protein
MGLSVAALYAEEAFSASLKPGVSGTALAWFQGIAPPTMADDTRIPRALQ